MKKYPIRANPETKKLIKPENLMIEENALMKDISLDIAYRVAYSTVKRREKTQNTGDFYLYQFYIIEDHRPNYFIYIHEKPTGLLGQQIQLHSVVVTSFYQVGYDVRVNIKMYRKHKEASPLYSKEITPELARIGWIDHVLTFFKNIKVANYDTIKATLLTEEILHKRKELVRKSKIDIIKFLIIC